MRSMYKNLQNICQNIKSNTLQIRHTLVISALDHTICAFTKHVLFDYTYAYLPQKLVQCILDYPNIKLGRKQSMIQSFFLRI